MDAVKVLAKTRDLVLQLQRIAVGIGHQQDFDIHGRNCAQKLFRSRQEVDALMVVAMQLHDIQLQALAPVIEAIPMQFTLGSPVPREQLLACVARDMPFLRPIRSGMCVSHM